MVGIDLFAGAGGLTLGLKSVGIETVCAVEIDNCRVETFAAHTPAADLINADIRKIDLSRYRGQVDFVYGGPPCQPFSSGGLRAAADDPRDMVPSYIRVIEQIRPDAFLMENVPGLAVGERRSYLTHVLDTLRDLGYFVTWKILNAAEYGIPQKRRRLFVVGLRSAPFVFPAETHGPTTVRPFVTVGDVLPEQQIGQNNPSRVFYAKNPDLRPSPYDGLLFNGGGRPIDRAQPGHTILASAGGNKTHFFDDGRLVPAYHEYLKQGGAPREGCLPGARRLTVEESAILQTFPKELQFCGSRSAQYSQVGDAVPPQLAAVVGRAIREQAAKSRPVKVARETQLSIAM